MINREKISSPLLLDGGLSTILEAEGHVLNHHLWTAHLIETNPEAIVKAHIDYLKSGSRCIISSSYQATIPGFIASGHSKKKAIELLKKTVELAELSRERFIKESNCKEDIFVAASIGPYGAYLADGSEFHGNYPISEDLLYDFHKSRINVLRKTNADFFAVETIPSFLEAKLICDILELFELNSWISFSCKDESHINDGTEIEDCVSYLAEFDHIFAIGVNCSSPLYIPILIQKIKNISNKRVIVYPNSGEHYHSDSKTWLGETNPLSCTDLAQTWLELGADIIGGCCRMGPEHIKAMHKAIIENK